MSYIRRTADIIISDDLRRILEEFEHKSLVAKLLLKGRHNKLHLVDDFVNYISTSKSDPSKISYLSPDRMSKIEPDEYWTTTRRFIAKPGSFIGKLFSDIPPKEVELFSNIFRLHTEKKDSQFKVVSGEEIKRWYHYDNYQSENSSLGSSCMKHDNCQYYFDIYVKNPEICKMLILTDPNNRLIGRALIWDVSDNKIMDRIYTVNDDKYQYQFKEWADKNGYWYKSEQRWNNCLWFESKGKKEVKNISFDLPNYEQGCNLPYMDTFKFCNIKTGKLYNDIPESNRNIRTLISSDGSYHDWNCLSKDDFSEIYYHRNETVELEYLDNRRILSSLVKYSESNGVYIHNDHAIWMEQARDWIFNEEFNHLNNTDSIENRVKLFDSKIGTRKISQLFDLSNNIYNGSWDIVIEE